jgi:hypothetical protein
VVAVEPALEGLVGVGATVRGDLVGALDVGGELQQQAVGSSVYSDRQ